MTIAQKITFGVIVAVSISGLAQAEDTTRREQARDNVTKAVCQRSEQRIETRVNTLTAVRTRRIAAYGNSVERYQKLVDRLDEAGYDTTKLREDAKEFNRLVLAFGEAFTAHLDALKATQAFPCGESNGEFLRSLDAARDKLRAVREAADAIRDYWRNTIRPDLQAIKNQQPAANN
ncbi:MAG: hypothetical protein AAB701_00380 [Patescibacteria group bacterium]